MNHEIQLRQPAPLPDVADPFGSYETRVERTDTIFQKMHRVLRGRYRWCILLGIILGGAGGAAGYLLTKPQWTASGIVVIRSYISPILGNTPGDVTGALYAPDQFKETQIAFIKGQRVIDTVLRSDGWKSLNRDNNSDAAVTEFLKQLKVESTTRSDVVSVTFPETDPKASFAAVSGVLDAYGNIYVEANKKNEVEKRATLNTLASRWSAEITSTKLNIATTVNSFVYGTDELRPILDSVTTQYKQVRAQIGIIEGQLRFLRPQTSASSTQPTTQPNLQSPDVLTAEQIARLDRDMRNLLNLQRAAETQLKSLEQHGLLPNSRLVKDAQLLYNERAIDVQNYVKDFNDNRGLVPANAQNGAGSTPGGVLPQSVAGLEKLLKDSKEQEEALLKEMKSVGTAARLIDDWKIELAHARLELESVEKRMRDLEVESPKQGRVEIPPVNPAIVVKDGRIPMAAVGGVFGVMMGFGIVLAIGLRDHRFRSVDDIRSNTQRIAMLGVLPSLPDDLADPEQAAIAAHCVHQIRTLLQIGPSGVDRRVFVITSPAAGTGKTSLCLALGVSFAASNARTLLIDCDLVGGGLTTRVDSINRRKIGQILKREGSISQQQLEQAIKLAQNSRKKLGEVLVDLGYLTEAEIAKALLAQDDARVGILDALNGEALDDCIIDTGIEGLSILPLGSARPSDVSKISPVAMHSVLEQARQRFDTILIDTGPVPGSLEASIVSAAADAVVMVVSRGEHRPFAEKSLQHLQDIGARVAGMVFNRAEGRDMYMASTTQRLSSYDRVAGTPTEVVAGAESPKFGPVARAVATRASTSKSGTRAQP
jgi:Mrp family chromosome partitioning ATPase/uncharacterized protein involved in exopolysaccharide biosynthesis